ncbi:YDG/SRA domain-containing protein [Paractinoplanes lichenicola]|uniref:HNH endonuclease n=1 Tax=Paractinoplanes lichenicola TaxID=2802976 RepID=A0ABS1W5Y5_9ACTN|nr:YDG/SRA domain-containing protein [Actinoplanes lichenicola]MBL7262140.1 HNH endonuclease [Actinoplanes lichenicola]
MAKRTYGEIAGFPPGSMFADRRALYDAGVHRVLQGGICGGKDGSESIVVSGGYPDDEDYGNELIYTGHGGRLPDSDVHVADQEFIVGNAGLARSSTDGNPVRVIRGAGGVPDHSPPSGFRYDGLFRVADYWHATGRDGFRVWRFYLVQDDQPELLLDDEGFGAPGHRGPVDRTQATIQRLARSTAKAQRVKALHRHNCQVCGICIETPAGRYAEAAHIQGLGKPHHGPDLAGNILCLCPNHHVMFDTGAIYVDHGWTVRYSANDEEIGELRRMPSHVIDVTYLAYHRMHVVP